MIRRILIAFGFLFSIYLDSVFFARVNLYGVRPDALLALIVPLSVMLGSVPGAVMGLLLGLFMDVLFGKYIGLTAVVYMVAGFAGGFFYRKYYADNFIVPTAVTAVFAFVKEMFFGIVVMVLGIRYNVGAVLIQYIIPCTFLTAAWSILAYIVYKPLLMGKAQKSNIEKSAGSRAL